MGHQTQRRSDVIKMNFSHIPHGQMLWLWNYTKGELNDTTEHRAGYYADDTRAPSSMDDWNACIEDFEAGNERAARYIAKLIEIRLRGN